MTDPTETKPALSPLDHDGDGRPGGAKKPPVLEWVVTRDLGLHQVPSRDCPAVLQAGGRRATARDLAIAGIEQDPA